MNLFVRGNLQYKSKGQAECLSDGAFHAIREYQLHPLCFRNNLGKVFVRPLNYPEGLQKIPPQFYGI